MNKSSLESWYQGLSNSISFIAIGDTGGLSPLSPLKMADISLFSDIYDSEVSTFAHFFLRLSSSTPTHFFSPHMTKMFSLHCAFVASCRLCFQDPFFLFFLLLSPKLLDKQMATVCHHPRYWTTCNTLCRTLSLSFLHLISCFQFIYFSMEKYLSVY